MELAGFKPLSFVLPAVFQSSWVSAMALTSICFCLLHSDCDCTFKGRCKLREHLRSHTQEKVVACPTCGGMFANNTKFFDHIRRQTTLDREYRG